MTSFKVNLLKGFHSSDECQMSTEKNQLQLKNEWNQLKLKNWPACQHYILPNYPTVKKLSVNQKPPVLPLYSMYVLYVRLNIIQPSMAVQISDARTEMMVT